MLDNIITHVHILVCFSRITNGSFLLLNQGIAIDIIYIYQVFIRSLHNGFIALLPTWQPQNWPDADAEKLQQLAYNSQISSYHAANHLNCV